MIQLNFLILGVFIDCVFVFIFSHHHILPILLYPQICFFGEYPECHPSSHYLTHELWQQPLSWSPWHHFSPPSNSSYQIYVPEILPALFFLIMHSHRLLLLLAEFAYQLNNIYLSSPQSLCVLSCTFGKLPFFTSCSLYSKFTSCTVQDWITPPHSSALHIYY